MHGLFICVGPKIRDHSMINAILTLLIAVAAAVPTIWAWKKYAAKAKVRKQKKKDDEEIIQAVRSGDVDAVARLTTKLLHS